MKLLMIQHMYEQPNITPIKGQSIKKSMPLQNNNLIDQRQIDDKNNSLREQIVVYKSNIIITQHRIQSDKDIYARDSILENSSCMTITIGREGVIFLWQHQQLMTTGKITMIQ